MDNRYYLKKTIGKNAEDIFRFIVESTEDWKIIPYGIENHIELLKENVREDYCEVSEKIRHMPDFVIINKKEKKVYFFEVKRLRFVDRREEDKLFFSFQKNQIDKYKKYWNEVILFIVHQQEPYFYIINIRDIDLSIHKDSKDHFNRTSNFIEYRRPYNRFNFKEIVKGIKDFFPNISDEVIKEASKMIMEYDPEPKTQEDLDWEKEITEDLKTYQNSSIYKS